MGSNLSYKINHSNLYLVNIFGILDKIISSIG